jgi:hypothetical protein
MGGMEDDQTPMGCDSDMQTNQISKAPSMNLRVVTFPYYSVYPNSSPQVNIVVVASGQAHLILLVN